MSRFSEIKDGARRLARGRNDQGTVDQEQARIERAKQEARREAKRERTQQRAQQADAEDKKLGAIEDLANDNAGRIGAVEDDLDALSPQSDRGGQQRSGGRRSAPDLDIDPGEFDPDLDDLGGGGL